MSALEHQHVIHFIVSEVKMLKKPRHFKVMFVNTIFVHGLSHTSGQAMFVSIYRVQNCRVPIIIKQRLLTVNCRLGIKHRLGYNKNCRLNVAYQLQSVFYNDRSKLRLHNTGIRNPLVCMCFLMINSFLLSPAGGRPISHLHNSLGTKCCFHYYFLLF